MEQINIGLGQQYDLPINDYHLNSIQQPKWVYMEPKHQQVGYSPWVYPYGRPSNTFKSDGSLPAQILQTVPWQNYYEPQTINVHNINSSPKQYQPFVESNWFKPSPGFLYRRKPLSKPSDRLLPSYYSVNMPSSSNLNKIPHPPHLTIYPLKQNPHPKFMPVHTTHPDLAGPAVYPNSPWYSTHPHLRTPVPSMDVMNQSHGEDDFDDTDSINENINTNLKDSKFLQLIMKHLQGLIIMKDDNDGMHPKDDN